MSGDQTATATFLARLLEQGIKPNAEAIARIHANGDIALVPFEVAPEWRARLEEAGFSLEVRPLTAAQRRQLSGADHVSARWVKGKRPGRIYVVSGSGTLLVNHDESGFAIEPGSTDREVLS